MSDPDPAHESGGAPGREVLVRTAAGACIEVRIDDATSSARAPATPCTPGGGPSPGPAPVVVLLPSSLRDSLDLTPLALRLAAAGFRVLRPQPRGMGRSSAPADGLTLHHLARDVADTIVAVGGGGRAIVAGHAFGHFVARVTDLDHPRLVRGVVLLAAAARAFPPGLTQALDLAADAAQPRAARLAALERAFFAPGHDASPWLDGWYPQWRERYRAAAAVPDKAAWWPACRAPMLDLQGDCDPWRPPATRDELRAQLGERVTTGLIADASHALPCEQPAAVAEAIVNWAHGLPP